MVLKCDKLKEVKEVQSENIPPISLTLIVLKFDKSKDFKEEQP
jgi:hypothetical protein